MKIDGYRQAKILTPDEIHRLSSDGFQSERDRTLFGICLCTGYRISEVLALALALDDIADESITFRQATTKKNGNAAGSDLSAAPSDVGELR